MSGSRREALPHVRELSGVSTGCPGVVGDPPGSPVVVEMPSRMAGSGWEAFPDVWKWSGGLSRCHGVVWRPSRMSGSSREA